MRAAVSFKRTAAVLGEIVGALAAATVAVALLEKVAPIAGLGVLYLLAVFFVAVRRGEVPALATAVAAVLTLNFFFIEPRHRLTIADSRNVVSLAVFLIAAVLVGRLAGAVRQRAAESEQRARVAAEREREAALLAGVASSLVGDAAIQRELESPQGRAATALSEAGLRLELTAAPSSDTGEVAVPLPLAVRRGWLHGMTDAGWDKDLLRRVADPLARLIDVALERERVSRQAAEAETAQRADVAKTAVLHAISHDLRSPLTAISTAASALQSGSLSNTDRDDLLSVIAGESGRLGRLVADLLDLSRIEAGAVNPQADWCDLGEGAARAAEQVGNDNPDATIELDMTPDLPLVHADPVQMERVFSNLIENAVKFSPAGSPVRVSASGDEHRVTVRVVDSGRGIPPADRAHVFEPFFRGPRDLPGSGLGLAISRGFVEANGGRITLQPGVRSGTAFAVSFPVAHQAATAT
jgi:two-component system, OmpR family, sensor histidine kinase KdpD